MSTAIESTEETTEEIIHEDLGTDQLHLLSLTLPRLQRIRRGDRVILGWPRPEDKNADSVWAQLQFESQELDEKYEAEGRTKVLPLPEEVTGEDRDNWRELLSHRAYYENEVRAAAYSVRRLELESRMLAMLQNLQRFQFEQKKALQESALRRIDKAEQKLLETAPANLQDELKMAESALAAAKRPANASPHDHPQADYVSGYREQLARAEAVLQREDADNRSLVDARETIATVGPVVARMERAVAEAEERIADIRARMLEA